jgi:hypothetical protein
VKRLLSFAVIASLLFTPAVNAAPKKISVKPMQLLTTVGTPDEVSGVVASGKSLIVFGSKASKAYARAVDTTGKEIWNLSLDPSAASIATAAANFNPFKSTGVSGLENLFSRFFALCKHYAYKFSSIPDFDFCR